MTALRRAAPLCGKGKPSSQSLGVCSHLVGPQTGSAVRKPAEQADIDPRCTPHSGNIFCWEGRAGAESKQLLERARPRQSDMAFLSHPAQAGERMEVTGSAVPSLPRASSSSECSFPSSCLVVVEALSSIWQRGGALVYKWKRWPGSQYNTR